MNAKGWWKCAATMLIIFKGIPNFKEHRHKLVTLDASQEVVKALDNVLEVLGGKR